MAKHNLSNDELHLSNFPSSENFKENFLASYPEGLTIYEDLHHTIIEAALPGLSISQIQILHNNGYLIIEGDKEEEKVSSERKYHRIASHCFSYRIKLPNATNEDIEPTTCLKNGIMRVSFPKKTEGK